MNETVEEMSGVPKAKRRREFTAVCTGLPIPASNINNIPMYSITMAKIQLFNRNTTHF